MLCLYSITSIWSHFYGRPSYTSICCLLVVSDQETEDRSIRSATIEVRPDRSPTSFRLFSASNLSETLTKHGKVIWSVRDFGTSLVLAKRQWCFTDEKVIIGLVESNGSLPPGYDWVTCVDDCFDTGISSCLNCRMGLKDCEYEYEYTTIIWPETPHVQATD